MPESQRTPGDRPFDSTVCPGYAARLPEVAEAARALSWSKRGSLVPLYGNRELPPVATEAVDVLDGAASKVERDLIRQSREGIGDG